MNIDVLLIQFSNAEPVLAGGTGRLVFESMLTSPGGAKR
jgi:hypothetical protein